MCKMEDKTFKAARILGEARANAVVIETIAKVMSETQGVAPERKKLLEGMSKNAKEITEKLDSLWAL